MWPYARMLLVCSVLGMSPACAPQNKPVSTPVEQAWEKAAPTPAEPARVVSPTAEVATSQPADLPPSAEPPVIAFVNNQPIFRAELMDMLIESHGTQVLEQLILLAAARQQAEKMGLQVTLQDVTAAEDDALHQIAAPIGDPQQAPLDRPAAQKLLDEFLRAKNISSAEWKCRMQQRAYLHEIAVADVGRMEITEQMLRDEYALLYGERVQIRHIQLSSPEACGRAVEMLAKTPFDEVARQLSENSLTAQKGGLMPPFARYDGAVPPLIREKAFALQPGEVSAPLRESNWYHIIRVERRFPASSVGFENVDRETLRQSLTGRLVAQRQEALEGELFQAAHVDIREDTLRRQFRQKYGR